MEGSLFAYGEQAPLHKHTISETPKMPENQTNLDTKKRVSMWMRL